jgi:hypothetical protein
LALKKSFPDKWILLNQIEAKAKAKHKLPTGLLQKNYLSK